MVCARAFRWRARVIVCATCKPCSFVMVMVWYVAVVWEPYYDRRNPIMSFVCGGVTPDGGGALDPSHVMLPRAPGRVTSPSSPFLLFPLCLFFFIVPALASSSTTPYHANVLRLPPHVLPSLISFKLTSSPSSSCSCPVPPYPMYSCVSLRVGETLSCLCLCLCLAFLIPVTCPFLESPSH